jgi:glyoxylase-like metal-dependent hydrolase (beta-lactamase superfamily II)
MFVQDPQKLSAHVHYVGSPMACNFVIETPTPALVDAGFTFSAPKLQEDVTRILGGPEKLRYLFLTHSHYDHVGCVAFLKRTNPDLTVVGHPRMQKVFDNPRALALIRELNRQSERLAPLPEAFRTRTEIDRLRLDRPVRDGEIFHLGDGVTVRAMYSPGHTRDCVWYYLLPDRVLFGGDGLGVYTGDGSVMAEFTSSFANLMASLRRLQGLEIEILALPHSGVVVGKEDVEAHIEKVLAENQRYHDRILRGLRKHAGDVQAVVDDMTREEYEIRGIYQPEEAFRLNLEAMVRVVLRELKENEER